MIKTNVPKNNILKPPLSASLLTALIVNLMINAIETDKTAVTNI